MKITIIAVGKIKEAYFTMAIEEYKKRLSRYCKLEILEVIDEKIPESLSKAQEEQVKRTEGERIQKLMKENAYTIALAIEGREFDSVGFSKELEQLGVKGKSHIQFLIGGSLGLDSELLKQADMAISFSKMTFPHQLMRVILLEQLYRSYRIQNHEPYHK